MLRDRTSAAAPEAFCENRLLNLWGRRWHRGGHQTRLRTPVDGRALGYATRLSQAEAKQAVAATIDAHRTWRCVGLHERRARVHASLDAIADHRDLLALLLAWEIGKPWRLACADVDRCLDGVRWYLDRTEDMLNERSPLDGPVSNIASWNYPMSVLMHAMLVQVLVGNAAIAKTPSDGGGHCLALACALAQREGLPLSLVSGSGPDLSPVLVQDPGIGGVVFVGGRRAGYDVQQRLANTEKRHMLEQEGLNCWGIWEFSQWDLLAEHLHKGFEYGKQRCTAYPRYVVQRDLLSEFLAMYLPILEKIKVGHPLAVEDPCDPLPELDFGPLISANKVEQLEAEVEKALHRGALPIYRGRLDESRFVPTGDRGAYMAPSALLAPPPSSKLYHAEPFGPVDTIVVVDTEAQLLAQMNVSNGALVASLACDSEATGARLLPEIAAFKVGINRPRSRGDREEVFGGFGASWRGAFVGGELLVHAVTQGARDERLHGNFPTYLLSPPR